MKREPVGTVLVGPSVLLREGLTLILGAAGFRILASASGVDEPVLSSFSQEQSILLVIDVGDDVAAALRQIESFKQRCSAGRVAVLAHQEQQLTNMVSAFRAGANAYLVKVATRDTFIKSLELVMLGVTLLPPEILAFISDNQDPGRDRREAGSNESDVDDWDAANDDDDGGDDGEMVGKEGETNEHAQRTKAGHTRLSARQQSILGCLTQGDSNKIIARKMAISEATVKVHVKAILRKIRVQNRTQAAFWAMNTGSLMLAKDGALPPALEKAGVEPFPSADVAQVVPATHESRSVCLSTLKETNNVVLSDIVHLVHERRRAVGHHPPRPQG